jgi:hypothetical protein
MSFAITAVVITVISTAVSMTAQYQQAQTQQKWSDYNAKVQQQQANEVLRQSEQEASRKRAEGERLIARQHVLYAKAGLDLSGTPEELMIGTAEEVEQDAQLIIHKGEMGYDQGMESSILSKGQGEMEANAGMAKAGETLLSGLGKAYGQYSSNYQPGSGGGGR